jgi:putative transcriptional regulator
MLTNSYASLTDQHVSQLLLNEYFLEFAMTTKQKFKSDAFASIHDSAAALQRVGAIDQTTMRQFDETGLVVPLTLAPTQIKNIREQVRVSQPVFARYLNTSESTVQKWESGSKQPSGMALKLLAIVQKHGLGVLV